MAIATYNRAALLERALESLRKAIVPAGLCVRVMVADNNSQDGTREVVERFAGGPGIAIEYLFCGRKQGKSAALNDAIQRSSADIIGFIDDDERVRQDWFQTIYRAFQDDSLGFMGGPCAADPEAGALPAWIPQGYCGVLGITETPTEVFEYTASGRHAATGGNMAFRRALLAKIGVFSEDLGPDGKHLLACEDDDLFRRALAFGARGVHHPELAIYHHTPQQRISHGYFRRWAFWRGVSHQPVEARYAQGAFWLGVPRWRYRQLAEAVVKRVFRPLRPRDETFSDELTIIDFAGRLYGLWLWRGRAKRGATG